MPPGTAKGQARESELSPEEWNQFVQEMDRLPPEWLAAVEGRTEKMDLDALKEWLRTGNSQGPGAAKPGAETNAVGTQDAGTAKIAHGQGAAKAGPNYPKFVPDEDQVPPGTARGGNGPDTQSPGGATIPFPEGQGPSTQSPGGATIPFPEEPRPGTAKVAHGQGAAKDGPNYPKFVPPEDQMPLGRID